MILKPIHGAVARHKEYGEEVALHTLLVERETEEPQVATVKCYRPDMSVEFVRWNHQVLADFDVSWPADQRNPLDCNHWRSA